MKTLLFPLLLLSSPVFAQNSSELSHTATVERMCTISTVQNMVFPSIDVNAVGQTFDAQGILRIHCNKGAGFNVTVGKGGNSSVTYTQSYREGFNPYTHNFGCQRAMSNGSSTLAYTLIKGDIADPYNGANEPYAVSVRQQYGTPGNLQTLDPALYASHTARACDNPFYAYASLTFTINAPQNIIVRGRIAPTKNVRYGAYVDYMTINITF